jgi:hypothetical protein
MLKKVFSKGLSNLKASLINNVLLQCSQLCSRVGLGSFQIIFTRNSGEGSLSAFPLTRTSDCRPAEVVVQLRPLLQQHMEHVPLADKGQEHPDTLEQIKVRDIQTKVRNSQAHCSRQRSGIPRHPGADKGQKHPDPLKQLKARNTQTHWGR